MGCRAKRDDQDQWRKHNAHRLIAAGLPVDVVENKRRFYFIVQEAWDPEWLPGGTGWTLERIDDNQARALLALLLEGFKDPDCTGLIADLQRRLETAER